MSSIFDGMADLFVAVLGDTDLVPYTHAGTTVNVKGIFDDPDMLFEIGESASKVVTMAKVSFAEADLHQGYGQGDTVRIKGVGYVVRNPLRDGKGMVSIDLEKA